MDIGIRTVDSILQIRDPSNHLFERVDEHVSSFDEEMTAYLENGIVVDNRFVLIIASAQNELFRAEFRAIELNRRSSNSQ